MPTWHLQNANEMAASHKRSFFKPSRAAIRMLRPGQFVKLSFLPGSDEPDTPEAEHLLVRVIKIKKGVFLGRLSSAPKFIRDLNSGDQVIFQVCHILGTQHDPVPSFANQDGKWYLVSNRVLRDGANVGFLYRDVPTDNEDSGWTITADDESSEYMHNQDNLQYVSREEVLRKDDSIADLLDSPSGSAFYRDATTGEFIPLVDDGLDHICASCRASQKEAETLRMKNGAPSAASLH
jgi:hypothetical protein